MIAVNVSLEKYCHGGGKWVRMEDRKGKTKKNERRSGEETRRRKY